MRNLRGGALICVAYLAAACGSSTASPSPTPVATPADIPRFDRSVADALAYFEQFGAECIGPAEPFADVREWLCIQDQVTATNTVRITGDTLGVSQLVAVSENQAPDLAISFLIGTVVPVVAPLPQGEDMLAAAVSQPERGGTWLLEEASVALQPHSKARAVVITPPP